MKTSDILIIIAAFFFPPVAVFLISGCGEDLVISILLSFVGYFPGMIHAFWLVYKKLQAQEAYGEEGYEYVGHGNFEPLNAANSAQGPPPSYGATENV